jgi:hypothetical protein
MTPAAYAVARSGDYSISTAEMAIALSAIPPHRRSNAWLLLMGLPVGASVAREAIRGGGNSPLPRNFLTVIGPAAVAILGTVGLIATRYAATRPRARCGY